MPRRLLPLCLWPLALGAQTICSPTPAWSPCDITFELSSQDATANPNPYLSVRLEVEFRSPRFHTYRMPAFWDGGRRLVIRFSPTEAGEWIFHTDSNLPDLDGKEGRFTATGSKSPGFLQPANVHHWAFVEDITKTPHLWMGDTLYSFPFIDRQLFEKIIDTRAAQKFNHVRGVVLARPDGPRHLFRSPDQPDPALFQELDQRILYMNRKGIIADLVLAWDQGQLEKLFPSREQRMRYVRYLVARYAAMDITWQGVQEFEEYADGRALLKDVGQELKRLDPYQHPRSTHTLATSAPLLADGWMNYIAYQTSDDHVGAIEHQLYLVPAVNAEFGYEDSGAGKSQSNHVDTDTFRHRLWNATMDGQYPTFGNTGTHGGGKFPVDARYLDSPGARQMTVWFDFFSKTRHWELEPFFDVDGGRAIALEGVEYIIYVEKPGPVELLVEKHGYDVAWLNPITGESVKQKKGFKGDRFSGEPPDKTHDWVLHISREGHKESMLRSYKFESRQILGQEVEQNPQKAPFEIAQPATDTLSLSHPPQYAAKVTRDTRATRAMMWLWTGEVPADEQGYRVIGTGAQGTFEIPRGIVRSFPSVLTVRLYGMNALGKVYSLIHVYKLSE